MRSLRHIAKLSGKPTETLENLRAQNARLEDANRDLVTEVTILTAELETRGDGLPWWQSKGARQRHQLDTLNRKIITQRFVLRTLEHLGRGLTRYEYELARANTENGQVRERIEDPE